MEEHVGVSYADKFISFEGALTTREIKTMVSKSKSDTVVQTDAMPLDLSSIKELNRGYFAKWPSATLRIYCSHDCDIKAIAGMSEVRNLIVESSAEILNLDALYELHNLRSLCIMAPRVSDKNFLQRLPSDLKSLDLNISSKAFDLKNLSRFTDLEILSLHKCNKNLEAVSKLAQLRALKLHGITPGSYAEINNLPKLERLSISGGNTADLSELYGNANITRLYLFRLAKLDSLSILAELPNLQIAEIGQLAHVEKLPELSNSKLEHLCFENMKGLLDFTALEDVPHIKTVTETVCPSTLGVENVLPILRNKNIEKCAFYTSSNKRNAAIMEAIEVYGKVCESNVYEVRHELFPDGWM